jgi:hypothetical protein
VTVQEFLDLINLVNHTNDFDAMLAAAEQLTGVLIDDLEFDPGHPRRGRTVGKRQFTRRAALSLTWPLYVTCERALDHAVERMAREKGMTLEAAADYINPQAYERIAYEQPQGSWWPDWLKSVAVFDYDHSVYVPAALLALANGDLPEAAREQVLGNAEGEVVNRMMGEPPRIGPDVAIVAGGHVYVRADWLADKFPDRFSRRLAQRITQQALGARAH